MFMETSAKTGLNVKALFTKIAYSLPGSERSATQHDPTTATQRTTIRLPPLALPVHPGPGAGMIPTVYSIAIASVAVIDVRLNTTAEGSSGASKCAC